MRHKGGGTRAALGLPGCRVLLKLFDNFVSLLAAITRVVCILMTMALFAIVIAAIVARYGFGQAVSWTEEVPPIS